VPDRGELTLEEIIEVLGLPLATVNREWRDAQVWLYPKLRKTGRRDK